MRYLILSDIHANIEALEAVLANANGHYDRIVCCGDLVGYGPDPNAVVEWVRNNVDAVIRGNHDKGCCGLDDLEWFNPLARAVCQWTAGQLTNEHRDFLRGLRAGPLDLAGFQLVHGSPLDEDEYVISINDAKNIFPYVESSLIFFGHTHLQCCWLMRGGRYESVAPIWPAETERQVRISPDASYLINPGSVGQPRDGDARAAYAIYDTETREVLQRRCHYNVAETQRKLRMDGLPEPLALRLEAGR